MFIVSSPLHHPASMTYSSRKPVKRLSLQPRQSSEISFLRSPTGNFSDPRSCQIQLVTALQGADVDATTRHLVAMCITEMEHTQKKSIMEFLTQIAIPAAMENNACKVFECATTKFDKVLDEDNVTLLTALWRRTLTEIVPTIQAMVYPLKSFDPLFDVRREILKSFRDRVLTRILHDVHFEVPKLRPMICSVSFATADQSTEFERFNEIADRVLGTNNGNETEDNDDMAKLKKIAKSRLSVPYSMDIPHGEMYTKTGTTVLPNITRTVRFSDEVMRERTASCS